MCGYSVSYYHTLGRVTLGIPFCATFCTTIRKATNLVTVSDQKREVKRPGGAISLCIGQVPDHAIATLGVIYLEVLSRPTRLSWVAVGSEVTVTDHADQDRAARAGGWSEGSAAGG